MVRTGTVVIQGAGGLGLNAVSVASERGAETIVVDGVKQRLQRAEEFGADHTVDLDEYETVDQRVERVRELTDGLDASIAVEVAGVPDAFSEGVRLLRDSGRYLEMGNIIPGRTTKFDPGKLTRKSITITSVMRYDPWYLHDALQFLADHSDEYPFHKMLNAEFELLDGGNALRQSRERNLTRASLIPDHEE